MWKAFKIVLGACLGLMASGIIFVGCLCVMSSGV